MIELTRSLSVVQYMVDDGTLRFAVPFPYLDKRHVHAIVGEDEEARSVGIEWVNSSTVEIAEPPEAEFKLTLRRITPIDKPLINFRDGANLPAADVNKALLQLLYAQQEANDAGASGLPGGNPGGGSGSPDIATIIDEVFRSPALSELLTRLDLIDMNAEMVLEDILRSHDFYDVKREYGDKISTAEERITLAEEAGRVVAQQYVDLFARVQQGETDVAARFLEVNEAVADANQAIAQAKTELHAQFTAADGDVAAALNQRVDTVVADANQALAQAEQRIGVEFDGKIAQVNQSITTLANDTSASIEELETAVAAHGENIGAHSERLDILADAEGANTSFRQSLAAKYGENIGAGIANEIDGKIAPVVSSFDQQISAEASAREALAEQVTTLQVTTAPTYFGPEAPTPPTGGFKVPTYWVKTGQTGAYTLYAWNGSSWLPGDLDEGSPTGALIQNLASTRITATQAQSIAATQVQAFKDGDFAAIRQEFDVVAGEHAGMYGQWQASYSVKINAGTVNGVPVIAGIALSANPETGTDFLVMADRFAFIHPQYTQGGQLAAIKYPFVVGKVGGVDTVGITGQLIVDGTVTADKVRANTLSAISANAGTINGGTFKTHTLDAEGNVVDPNEFRFEASNVGNWPIWVGSGSKTENNAVFWVDRLGNAGFNGTVSAPNIVGNFQKAIAVNIIPNVYVPPNELREVYRFTLPKSDLVGEKHAPAVTVTVGHDGMRSCIVYLEYLDGSQWRRIGMARAPIVWGSKDAYVDSFSETISASVAPTASDATFRVLLQHQTPTSRVVNSLSGFAIGIR